MNLENQQKICVKCGATISLEDNFCGNCGAKNTERNIIEEIGKLVITKLGVKKDANIENIKNKILETTKLNCTKENLPKILEILKKLPDYLSCPKCGVHIFETDKFCGNCGIEVVLEKQTKKDKDSVTEIIEKKEKKINYYLKVLKKYAMFNGRAQRAEYWYFFLFNIIISFVLVILDMVTDNFNPELGLGLLSGLYSLVVLIPGIAVSVRRLHDTNHSGWWLFILLVPVIGIIVYLVFMVKDSQSSENQYGLNPKRIEIN